MNRSQLPPAPSSEEAPGYEASRVEGACGDVSGVVQVRAPMKRPDGKVGDRLARLPHTMHGLSRGDVTNEVPRLPQTPAQIGVLPVEKVPLVESAHLFDRHASGHHAGA